MSNERKPNRYLFNREELVILQNAWQKEMDLISPNIVKVVVEMATDEEGFIAFEPAQGNGDVGLDKLIEVLDKHRELFMEPIRERINYDFSS